DVVDEQIDLVGKVFLGMTIGCARCHDHKFDPIPTADYYALAGIFRSTQTMVHSNVSRWVTTPLPLPDQLEQRAREIDDRIAVIEETQKLTAAKLKKLQKRFPVLTLDDDQAEFFGGWTESTSVKPFV